MSEPFIGEIGIFAGNFAPRGWALCDGQLLPISNNTALFSLLGTVYGGDGRSTFALPNMQARVPMHPGRGPGLTSRRLGQRTGAPTVTLNTTQIPSHNHTLRCLRARGDSADPTNRYFAGDDNQSFQYHTTSDGSHLNANAIQYAGGSQSHPNQQPYLGLNYIIALAGLYPSRG